jgi:predicted HicB family RNase H-like nuclease
MKDLLKYQDFSGTVQFSAEDEVFHGKIVGIDDLVTFEGQSVEELKNSFHNAIEDYLEICESIGKSPHKSYKGSFNIRIKPVVHKKAVLKSTELGLSLNQFVEQAIQQKLTSQV